MARAGIRRGIFAAVAAAAGLLLLELASGALPEPASTELADLAFAQADAPELYQSDPELGWRLRPGLELSLSGIPVRTSSVGLRGDEPRDPTILCLGDSVTFGYHVAEAASYPALLSRELGVETLAAGVPGYSAAQGAVLLGRLLERFSPRVVVISFGYNDGVRFPISDRGAERSRVGALRGALGRFALVRQIDHRFGQGRRLRAAREVLGIRARNLASFPPADVVAAARFNEGEQAIRRHLERAPARVPLARYRERLREMIQLAQGRGARVVLLAPPFASASMEPYFAASLRAAPVAAYRLAMQEVAREENVGFVRAPALEERRGAPDRELFVTRRLSPLESEGFRMLRSDEAFLDRLGIARALGERTDLAHPSAAGHAVIAGALLDLLRMSAPVDPPP